MPVFAVHASGEFLAKAQVLARRYGFTVEEGIPAAGRRHDQTAPTAYLALTDEGLTFCDPENRLTMRVDYLRGAAAYRLFAVGNSCEPLLAAMGLNKGALKQKLAAGETPYILDAGAGLGRDGLVMAAAGARVLMCERSPVMAALLEDGLARAAEDEKRGATIRERLELHFGDAREVLAARGKEFSSVYFDPMFPERTKTALVKKEMRLARRISGDDTDAAEILALARTVTPQVVVKRPLHAEPLSADVHRVVKGTRVRYDIYCGL